MHKKKFSNIIILWPYQLESCHTTWSPQPLGRNSVYRITFISYILYCRTVLVVPPPHVFVQIPLWQGPQKISSNVICHFTPFLLFGIVPMASTVRNTYKPYRYRYVTVKPRGARDVLWHLPGEKKTNGLERHFFFPFSVFPVPRPKSDKIIIKTCAY